MGCEDTENACRCPSRASLEGQAGGAGAHARQPRYDPSATHQPAGYWADKANDLEKENAKLRTERDEAVEAILKWFAAWRPDEYTAEDHARDPTVYVIHQRDDILSEYAAKLILEKRG